MDVTEHSRTGTDVELRVVDPDDVHHRLTVSTDGQVGRHWCEQYPEDGTDPSPIERERLARVERFARYYLARQGSDETLSPYTATHRLADPDRLLVATLLVGVMSQETLASQFEACYDRLTDRGGADTSPLTTSPAGPADWQLVEQDISLTMDTADVRTLADAVVGVDGLEKLRHALDVAPDRDDADLFARLDRMLSATDAPVEGTVTSDRFLTVDPPVRVYRNPPSQREGGGAPRDTRDSATDDPVAARLQLTPATLPLTSVAAFQRQLVDHLRCQLRDCYVGMGLRPPESARLTGPGIAACTERYERLDRLQNYHRDYAIIDWSTLGPRDDV